MAVRHVLGNVTAAEFEEIELLHLERTALQSLTLTDAAKEDPHLRKSIAEHQVQVQERIARWFSEVVLAHQWSPPAHGLWTLLYETGELGVDWPVSDGGGFVEEATIREPGVASCGND